MIKKINANNFIHKNIFIIIMLFLISIMSGLITWHSHFVIAFGDLYIHWQRIYDLKFSMSIGDFWPKVDLDRFNQTGSAFMTMYPKLNLYPIIFLSYFIKSFPNLIHATFILRNFVSLLIGYYSCYSYTKNKMGSFLFSTSYTLTSTILYVVVNGYDIGISSSVVFLPMVLFGCLNLLNSYKWLELTTGMILIMYCHVINSAITFLFIFIFIIFNIKRIINISVLKALCKCLVVTILTTGITWIPILVLENTNQIFLPNISSISGDNLSNILMSSLDPLSSKLSLFALIGLILSIIKYKRLPNIDRKLFWISILFIWACSSLFPWILFNDTFIKNALQFPWRLFIIPQLILCFLFSIIVSDWCNSKTMPKLYAGIVVVSIVYVQVLGQMQIFNNNYMKPELNQPYTTDASGNSLIRYDNNFYNLINGRVGIIDYYPQDAVDNFNNINNQLAEYKNKLSKNESVKIKLLGNGKFYINLVKNANNLKLPILNYHGIDYKVKIDNKNVKFHSVKSQITINKLKSGHHRIQVFTYKSWYDYLSYVLSALGVIVLAFAWIRLLLLKFKNR